MRRISDNKCKHLEVKCLYLRLFLKAAMKVILWTDFTNYIVSYMIYTLPGHLKRLVANYI